MSCKLPFKFQQQWPSFSEVALGIVKHLFTWNYISNACIEIKGAMAHSRYKTGAGGG